MRARLVSETNRNRFFIERHFERQSGSGRRTFMYISGLQLKAAPAPALQARRHAVGFARNTSTDERQGRLPDILTSAAKRNFISHRKKKQQALHGASKFGVESYGAKQNQNAVLSTDRRNNRNNGCSILQSSQHDDRITISKPLKCLRESNSQKVDYFVDNNNQIHERHRSQPTNRKPRVSEIIGSNNQAGPNTRKKSGCDDTGQYEPVAPSSTRVSRPRSDVETKTKTRTKTRVKKKPVKNPLVEKPLLAAKIPPPIRMYYVIGKGNNSILLMKMFRARNGWSPVEMDDPRANFIWTMYKKASTFRALKKYKEKNRILLINHFPGNSCLVTKKGLFHSLSRYHKKRGTDVAESVPMTFHLSKGVCDEQYHDFMTRAEILDKNCREHNKNGDDEIDASGDDLVQPETTLRADDTTISRDAEKKKTKRKTAKKKGSKSKKRSGAFWIVKPASMTNRGYGIKVVASVQEVLKIVNGANSKTIPAAEVDVAASNASEDGCDAGALSDSQEGSSTSSVHDKKKSSRKDWIVQKYMENPLLYNQRKFDIRCFVLLTGGEFSQAGNKPKQRLSCYLYTEGYLRTSSVKFSLDEKKLKNTLMHLTNDGIQNKDSKNYGKHEQGNKISYEKFQAYLSAKYPKKPRYANAVSETILPQIRKLVVETMEAVQDKIAGKTASCFELYGYDFMVDTDLKVWLIEVNSNPCLEDWSCPLLGKMISNMLSCMMKIAVDKPLCREQHTKDFESAAAPISKDEGGEANGRGSAFRAKKKSGIDGWSKPAPDYEENPALSAAQLERRKRLQQRHDFECVWTQNS